MSAREHLAQVLAGTGLYELPGSSPVDWEPVSYTHLMCIRDRAVTPQSITAGEVKLTQGGGSERAALLVEEKRRAVAPALEEPGFYFSQVRWKP